MINPETNLGAPSSVFEGGAFDFAFFLLVPYPPKPFTPPPQPFSPQFSLFTAKHLTS